jgi:NADH-quinone oxidoreductase subunit N
MSNVTDIYTLYPMLPEIVLALGAMAMLMLGVGLGDRTSSAVNGLSVGVLGLVALFLVSVPAGRHELFGGSFVVDDFARYLKMLAVIGSAGALLLSLDYLTIANQQKFEYGALFLLSTLGMLLLISANDLIALYLGLELMSLSLYVVAAFERDKTRSTAAGR